MMVEAGAQLNKCTWGSMDGQLSDPADKVCMNFFRGHSVERVAIRSERVFLYYVYCPMDWRCFQTPAFL